VSTRYFSRVLDEALDGLLSTPKVDAPDLDLDADGVLSSLSNDLDDSLGLDQWQEPKLDRKKPKSQVKPTVGAPKPATYTDDEGKTKDWGPKEPQKPKPIQHTTQNPKPVKQRPVPKAGEHHVQYK